MRISRIYFLVFSIALLVCQPVCLQAFETDQYNLPPIPLADIGDEFTEHIVEKIREAASALNAEISDHEACLGGRSGSKCNRVQSAERLAYLRSETAIADEVYKRLGSGNLFVTKTGLWFKKHKFAATPDRYKIDFLHSFYVFSPANYVTISPTINMYGVELGYDKIEHILQQGHKYYSIKQNGLAKKLPEDIAEKKAIDWGKRSERTFFGYWVSGVYSNGDLYANYAGLKFYEGLARKINVGGQTRPAIVSFVEGRWSMNNDLDLKTAVLKPFINEGLNEAINPSVYAFNVLPTVRRVVRNQACDEWRKLMPNAKKADLDSRSALYETWNGVDYGFKKSSRMVRIGETCISESLTE